MASHLRSSSSSAPLLGDWPSADAVRAWSTYLQSVLEISESLSPEPTLSSEGRKMAYKPPISLWDNFEVSSPHSCRVLSGD